MQSTLKFHGVHLAVRASLSVALFALVAFPGCATSNWFRPVSGVNAPAKVFCGTEGPSPTSVVVSVYVEEPVEKAAFTVQPIVGVFDRFDQDRFRRRDGLSLPGKTTSCVRVPLPSTLGDVRLFNVAVHGHAGSEVLHGGEMACEPQPIGQLDCEIL